MAKVGKVYKSGQGYRTQFVCDNCGAKIWTAFYCKGADGKGAHACRRRACQDKLGGWNGQTWCDS